MNKEGYVYIFKAPKYFQRRFPDEPPLLKIGMAGHVSERMESLRKDCDLFDLARVDDFEGIPVNFYWKIEEQVHTELQNFRRVFPCKKCKSKNGAETKHKEWFAVTEEVALRAVQRWRKFIQQESYDENGLLKNHWSNMMVYKNMKKPTAEEKCDNPQRRHERWTRWLEEGVSGCCVGVVRA